MMNYFEIFGLPIQLKVDKKELPKRFFELSRKFHPDFYVNSTPSEKEKAFIDYWENNRLKEKSILKQFFPGLPIGLALGAAILLALDSGWYERANMIAQSQSSPVVLFIAIAGIVAFTGFFYKKFRWEMNEQAYKELKLKKDDDDTPVSP